MLDRVLLLWPLIRAAPISMHPMLKASTISRFLNRALLVSLFTSLSLSLSLSLTLSFGVFIGLFQCLCRALFLSSYGSFIITMRRMSQASTMRRSLYRALLVFSLACFGVVIGLFQCLCRALLVFFHGSFIISMRRMSQASIMWRYLCRALLVSS